MASGEAGSELAIKIDSKYHAMAVDAQIHLCAAAMVSEPNRSNARILHGIAVALKLLIDDPERQVYISQLRLRAVNSGSPMLSSSETDSVMNVVYGLTSHEARELARTTHGKKAWPFV